MDREEVLARLKGWAEVNRIEAREQAGLSPARKLRLTASLFDLARRLGWDEEREGRDAGLAEVRRRWEILRARLDARWSD